MENPQTLQLILSKFEGEEVEIEVKAVTKRSSQQNRYYWGVVIAVLLDCMTNDHGITGEILKPYPITLEDVNMFSYDDRLTPRALDKFLLCRFHPFTEGMSTTSLNPHMFGSYIMQVSIWAKDVLNCDIPEATIENFKFKFDII